MPPLHYHRPPLACREEAMHVRDSRFVAIEKAKDKAEAVGRKARKLPARASRRARAGR